MDERGRWRNFLDKLTIEITPKLIDGRLIDRKIEDGSEWHIYFILKELLTIDEIKDLTFKIENAMLTNLGGKKCNFRIEYENQSNINFCLLDYFVDAINTIEQNRPDVTVIQHYPWEIKDNTIIIKIPNEAEKVIVEKYLDSFNVYFNYYGLKNVSFNLIIDNNNIDVKAKHDRMIANEENTVKAKAFEDYKQRKLMHDSEKVRDSFEYKSKNQTVDIQISDIPNTSFDLTAYIQMIGTKNVAVHGTIINSEIRSIVSKKNGKEYQIFNGIITDHKDSINITGFLDENNRSFYEQLQPNTLVDVIGTLEWNNFGNVPNIILRKMNTMGEDNYRKRFDGQTEKRVELHAHTKMTVLDSILNVEEYVEQASRFGHTALAVTDYENCHVLPEFFSKAKAAGIKPIAGAEVNFVDDSDISITLTDDDIMLSGATFTIFDIETTGFCINFHEIIEIGAVKVQNGVIIDTFSEFIKPKKPIPDYISNLTHITNDDVYSAPDIYMVLPRFKEFIKGSILVAHNAKFDTDFIYENMRRQNIFDGPYPCIDTLQLARCFIDKYNLKKFNLGALGKSLKIEVETQHRAIHDARTLNNIFMKLIGDIEELNIKNYHDLNSIINLNEIFKYVIPPHLNILVKNRVGLKNFYKIISDSQTTHYYKNPRVLKSYLESHREGLLIGSGDYTGEVFRAALEKTPAILKEKMKFYDYIEVQAPSYYEFLFEHTKDIGYLDYIKDTIQLIIDTAHELGKTVVATGDVHELIETDREYRKIYLSIPRPNGGGPHELHEYNNIPDCHFKTTTEMLTDFSFLDPETAYDIVVKNTNYISSLIDDYNLFDKQLFVPADNFLEKDGVPSMKQAIIDMCNDNCHKIFGDNIPRYVQERLDKELKAIIGHGYFSVYYISHLLVKNSNDNGYVVGSRGSVGSSYVANLMNITEVNPLIPHYVCPKCKFVAFKFSNEQKQQYGQFNVPAYIEEALQSAMVGYDLPAMKCPICGEELNREGVNIDFETFLGFTGEKVPDIDLNFSGEYQAQAHLFVQSMFGKDYAFRAGTISTVKLKTAAGYVRGYYEKQNVLKRNCEIERIASFIQDSKRTTGQHPGGIVVVPNNMEIYDITPIQFPPFDDKESVDNLNWRTTHFEYHTFEANLLKLDILGHDDPTMMKTLIGYVHDNPDIFHFHDVEEIPFIDEKILKLFSSKEPLNLDEGDLDLLSSGTIGIPEFGTDTTRRMLETIKPQSYNDIIKVSGVSHGTNVWFNNAESLVLGTVEELGNIKVPFAEVICCRDDIMNFLIEKGVDASTSFKIMEGVRKGKHLTEAQIKLMNEKNIPLWFIWTCQRIEYLFPKAHATAYVVMGLRISWFKIYHPIFYYAAYFSVRCKEFDAEVFIAGRNAIKNRILDIEKRIKNREDVKDKEKDLLDELYIAYEMTLRGLKFLSIDLNKSDATKFVISEDRKGLYLPFVTISALGESVASSIINERNIRLFSSIRDLESRTKLNKTQMLKLKSLGVLDSLPEDDVTSLF